MHVFVSASAVHSGSGDGLWEVGILLWIILVVAAYIWLHLAEREFARLYQAAHGPRFMTLEQEIEDSAMDPIGFFRRLPGNILRTLDAIAEPQADPNIESARQRVIHRRLAVLGAVWLGVALPIGFSFL